MEVEWFSYTDWHFHLALGELILDSSLSGEFTSVASWLWDKVRLWAVCWWDMVCYLSLCGCSFGFTLLHFSGHILITFLINWILVGLRDPKWLRNRMPPPGSLFPIVIFPFSEVRIYKWEERNPAIWACHIFLWLSQVSVRAKVSFGNWIKRVQDWPSPACNRVSEGSGPWRRECFLKFPSQFWHCSLPKKEGKLFFWRGQLGGKLFASSSQPLCGCLSGPHCQQLPCLYLHSLLPGFFTQVKIGLKS